jgi:6-pyruvoyltetrahydropterin/6-carboxytetrahydropterin synthase
MKRLISSPRSPTAPERAREDNAFTQVWICSLNNPYGHGHNYVLEVTLTGPVNPQTGMIANLSDLDLFVKERVLDDFDHRSMNDEIPAFRNAVPTTENLCIEIFKRLRDFPHAKLERIRIEETSKNSFEYFGPVEQ